MKNYLLILVIAALSFGCATQEEPTSYNQDRLVLNTLNGNENLVRQNLRDELIPFPQTTPFDNENEKRQAYLTGYCKAWEFGVSGDFLHAFKGLPALPPNIEEPWLKGWHDGLKISIDRWMGESERIGKLPVRQN